MKTVISTPKIVNKIVYANQNKQNYFERPRKRGNPSHADWYKMADIINDNIDSFPPNADFDEICQIVKEYAKINDIPLNRWAVTFFTNQILDLYCCMNFLNQLKTSNSTLNNCLTLKNKSLLLQAFDIEQYKELSRKQQIGFLLSHKSLVKEICNIIKH